MYQIEYRRCLRRRGPRGAGNRYTSMALTGRSPAMVSCCAPQLIHTVYSHTHILTYVPCIYIYICKQCVCHQHPAKTHAIYTYIYMYINYIQNILTLVYIIYIFEPVPMMSTNIILRKHMITHKHTHTNTLCCLYNIYLHIIYVFEPVPLRLTSSIPRICSGVKALSSHSQPS